MKSISNLVDVELRKSIRVKGVDKQAGDKVALVPSTAERLVAQGDAVYTTAEPLRDEPEVPQVAGENTPETSGVPEEQPQEEPTRARRTRSLTK